jgi:uncharacterized integral membrane protein
LAQVLSLKVCLNGFLKVVMVAERIQLNNLPQARHHMLMALFEQESAAEGLVTRLTALGLESGNLSFLRVALGEVPTQRSLPVASASSAHYSFLGVICGSFIALLLGMVLYAANFLQLSFLEAMLVHTLALVILGGVLGGAVGAILASIQAQRTMTVLPSQSADSFIILIKSPPHLTAQCEAIAHELGARKVLS